jgi:Histidinol-phosphate/aromatic aminotransferase and cobyric acid decarboxylase
MRYSKGNLADIPKTVHGGQAWKLDKVEDYSHNLNPLGPPDCLQEIIRNAVGGVGHYPDDSCGELKGVISKVFGIREENITMGAGSSEIIRSFPNTFMDRGDKVLLNKPSFAEYAQQCRIAGLEILMNDLSEENDFRIDEKKLSEKISSGIKAFYICNPNNPTGRIEPRKKIIEIVKECRDNGVLVFLDETLLELVKDNDKISCVKCVRKYDNLVVAGSLTKSFAIPGIRIGFGFADDALISEMEKIRMTWNIGEIEQNVARVLISEHMDHVHKAAKIMADESRTMRSQLSEIGFPAGNISDSFFYFCSLKGLGIKGSDLQRAMLKENVMIRDCASFGTPFEWFVRFSVKDRQRNEMFVKAAKKALNEIR